MAYKVFSAGKLHELSQQHPSIKLFEPESQEYYLEMHTKDHAPAEKSEMHDAQTDIYVVLEGHGEVHLGGTLRDATSPKSGQHRGYGLVGATRYDIKSGDFIVIPEGVPHMVGCPNSRMVFMVIKLDYTEDFRAYPPVFFAGNEPPTPHV